MLDDDLDPLIDDVARAMTSAPAGPDLARRVSMRIADTDGRGARSSMRRPWMLVPVASLCALVLAVYVTRQRARDTREPYVERGFQPRGRGPERAALQPPVQTPAHRLPAPAAAAIEPIAFDRVDIQPLVEMDTIQISPIAIDRIDIAAMP